MIRLTPRSPPDCLTHDQCTNNLVSQERRPLGPLYNDFHSEDIRLLRLTINHLCGSENQPLLTTVIVSTADCPIRIRIRITTDFPKPEDLILVVHIILPGMDLFAAIFGVLVVTWSRFRIGGTELAFS